MKTNTTYLMAALAMGLGMVVAVVSTTASLDQGAAAPGEWSGATDECPPHCAAKEIRLVDNCPPECAGFEELGPVVGECPPECSETESLGPVADQCPPECAPEEIEVANNCPPTCAPDQENLG